MTLRQTFAPATLLLSLACAPAGAPADGWTLSLEPVGSRVPPTSVTVSVNDGIYANRVSASTTIGEERVGSAEVSLDSLRSVGWTPDELFARISDELGVEVSGNLEHGIARTTLPMTAQKSTASSGTVNGAPQSSLLPPWSCLDGTASFGVELVQYRVRATRTEREADATAPSELVLGSIEIADALTIDWNVTHPEGCAGGCTVRALPELPH